MLKGTGIKAHVLQGKAAEKLAEKLGLDEWEIGIRYGGLHGFADPTPNSDGSYNVYVNPMYKGQLRDEILAHEIGHVTMYGSVMEKNSTAAEAQEVLNAFTNWLAKFGKDNTLHKELIASKKTPQAALLYLKSGLGEYRLKDLGMDTEIVQYLKDFDEWYADEASKALLRKLTKKGPVGVVQTYFNKLVNLLRKVFGKMSAVEKYLYEMQDRVHPTYDYFNKPLAALPAKLSTVKTKLNKEVSKQYNASMTQIFKDVLLDKDYNLRSFNIPALTELADLMHKKRGDTKSDKSLWTAKLDEMARYDEHVTTIMRGASKEQQKQIIQELYNEKLSDSQVSVRTRRIRSLFKDLQDYLEEAGVEINARKNYFPEIADVEYVEKHENEFKQMMARYPKEMESIAKKWNTDIDKRAHYLGITVDPSEYLKPEDVPQAIYENIVGTDGVYDEFASSAIQTPNLRFANHRIVDFLEGQDKLEWESNYLQSSVTDATAAYITQAVKRAEFERRFGKLNQDEKNDFIEYLKRKEGKTAFTKREKENFAKAAAATNKFEWLLMKARDQGATPDQLRKARYYLAAELGTLGKHTARWLHEKLGIPMPAAYQPINPTLQKIFSTIMSVANVWVLGLSTITSLADPVGIAVRTGSLSTAAKAFKQGLAANFSKNRTELTVLAEAVGAISDVATKEALAHGYNMAYMTPAVRRMNDWFFRKIGLEQWTRATRIMAVAAAQDFLKRHDTNPNQHSTRFLKELGLQKGDIKYGRDGKVKVLSYDEYQNASKQERESDDRLRLAIVNFVDESILRPSPSMRPAWASDPHYALLFHLKSFMYTFQKIILNPLVLEAKHGNYMPLLMVSAYIPVMLAAGMIKDMFKTLGDDDDDWTPDYKKNWDTFDYMWDAAEKGGLFGIAQPILDIRRDMRYGGSGLGAMYSPGLDPDTFSQPPVPVNYIYRNLFD